MKNAVRIALLIFAFSPSLFADLIHVDFNFTATVGQDFQAVCSYGTSPPTNCTNQPVGFDVVQGDSISGSFGYDEGRELVSGAYGSVTIGSQTFSGGGKCPGRDCGF